MLKRIEALQQEIEYLLEVRKKSGEGIHCEIKEVVGDTLVRTMVAFNGVFEFQENWLLPNSGSSCANRALRRRRCFFNDEGSLDWSFEVPEFIR